MFYNIILSVINFTMYFLLLSLILSFWGRLVLKFLHINNALKQQLMLEIISGIALIFFITYFLSIYIVNLTIYIFIFLFIGLLGIFIEFFYKYLKPWQKTSNKLASIIEGLKNRDTWLATLIIALVMSTIYSLMWPSGRMEGWINNGVDFHFWIFMAEYRLGLINLSNPSVTLFSAYELDAFGTQILVALTALSRFQLPYETAPAIVVTFLTWFGTAVYRLVAQTFKFTFFQSLFVSLALCLGNFLNYVSFTGMFAHLFFLIIFITCLTQIFCEYNQPITINLYVKRLFLPLFALLIAYQSAYILCSSFIILSIFILSFLSQKTSIGSRLFKNFCLSLSPVLIISGISALLLPTVTYHLFIRSLEVASQIPGWSIPLINPLLFTGLPLFLSTDQFKPIQLDDEVKFYSYFIFITIILLITLIVYIYNKHKNIYFQNKNNLVIFSLICIFIISIIFYLIMYTLFGNIYRIWKFSAYTILPLSFIPLCLSIYIIIKICKNRLLFINLILIIATIFYIIQISNLTYFQSLKHKYYNIVSRDLFISSILNLSLQFNKHNYLFHFSDPSMIFLSSIMLSNSSNKIFFDRDMYFILPTPFSLDKFTDDTIFITNVNYDSIITGSRFPIYYIHEPLHVYTSDSLKNKGYVYIKANTDNFLWEITNYPVSFNFFVPTRLINKDIVFSLTPIPEQELSPACDHIEFGLKGDNGQMVWTKKSVTDLTFSIPAQFSADGQLEVHSRMPFIEGEKCNIAIDRLDLELASNGSLK